MSYILISMSRGTLYKSILSPSALINLAATDMQVRIYAPLHHKAYKSIMVLFCHALHGGGAAFGADAPPPLSAIWHAPTTSMNEALCSPALL